MKKRLLIAKPVADELEKFEKLYKESIHSDSPRIQEIIDYTLKSDGKKIRPVLLLLAAKACGEINYGTYNAAVTIELLHTASLIHDDVVDESLIRRGQPSVNAVFDNKVAVLAGDYFLSTALLKSVMTGNLAIIDDVSNLGRRLAEGELNQIALVKERIVDEEEYFEVIKQKTASLLASCMRIGAITTGGTEEQQEMFRTLGGILGVCFQLRDDIFDYFDTNVGKPTGNDIREGKITLPLLYAIRNASEDEKVQILEVVSQENYTAENIEKLINFARDNGGIEYAYQQIEKYRADAETIIATIPNLEIREALTHAVEYIVDRVY